MTHFTYDNEGRLSTVTGHFSDTLTYHYDDEGYLVTITTPDGNLNYAYDESGSRGSLTPSPHNTLHAAPHRAFHLEW
ncbi:MAG: RHS repeat protein [Candidatus Thiodiazotropha sp. (ex Ustalcina ferruginea)]|nr:RHS repeat protein [Candidatus Thiodiazotropha sp. (ex Ustalcina ferruginea)]